jgi:hypothetical protein
MRMWLAFARFVKPSMSSYIQFNSLDWQLNSSSWTLIDDLQMTDKRQAFVVGE